MVWPSLYIYNPISHCIIAIFKFNLQNVVYYALEFDCYCLSVYFTECEAMGGSNEFYDKFSVRYHLSVILKQLWQHPDHRLHIIAESANTREDANFIRFVNMLINDTTFLLDESLDALKAIHETQEAMKDTEAWTSQPQV